jgi:hypothetical protein
MVVGAPPNDTSPAVQELIWQRLAAMSPEERYERFAKLYRFTRRMAIAGIRERYPNAPESEIRLRFAVQTMGREITMKFFNWDPEVQGY